MIKIRSATEADVEAIRAIVNREIAENTAHFGRAPVAESEAINEFRVGTATYPWYVAESGGSVIGFARGSAWLSRGAYEWACQVAIYVAPDHHGRGVGTLLYTALFDEVRRRGFRFVIGGVVLPNPASVRLHESMGMRHVGTLPRVGFKHGRWHDVGYWALTFDGDDPPAPIDGWPND